MERRVELDGEKVTALAQRAERKAAALLRFAAVKLMPGFFFVVVVVWLNVGRIERLAWLIEDILTLRQRNSFVRLAVIGEVNSAVVKQLQLPAVIYLCTLLQIQY